MSWIRLDEDFVDHPKIVDAGPLAGWLHVKAITYCNRYLTDGRMPRAVARALVSWDDVSPLRDAYTTDGLTSEQVNDHLIQRLVAAGMWIVRDNAYQIHDYLKFQPSRAKVLAERETERLRKEAWRAAKDDKKNVPPVVPPGQTPVSQAGPALSVSVSVSKEESTLVQPPAARPRFDFGPLYDGYPNKRGKTKAFEKLKALIRTEAQFQAFKHGLESFIRDEKRKGTEARYYPHFITFVNKRLWEDYSGSNSTLPGIVNGAAKSPAQLLAEEAKRQRLAEFEGQP